MANTHSLDLERSSSQYAWKDEPANLDITGDLTIEAWIKMESLNAATPIVMMGTTGETEADNVLYNFRVNDSGVLSVLWEYGSGSNEAANRAAADITTGTWYHVAIVRDVSENDVLFYVNGVLKETVSYTNDPTGGANGDLYVGTELGANYFDGKIDDLRIWNDVRTQSEIQANMRKQLLGSESNLVGYWRFNNSYADETSNSNNLTPINSPVFSTDVPAWPTGSFLLNFV